jgi:hypothetical protein
MKCVAAVEKQAVWGGGGVILYELQWGHSGNAPID